MGNKKQKSKYSLNHSEKSKEQILVDLVLQRKEPKTKFEKKLADSIKEISAKGGIVEIPFD